MNVLFSGRSPLTTAMAVVVAWLLPALTPGPCTASPMREMIEADWQMQAETRARSARNVQGQESTWADATGAVDGVKNGKYAFHTNREPNPWWQVDLGQPTALGRIVVYNRLDYKPGLHNADNLLILASNDGRNWTRRYSNKGKHFGGISGAPPLEVNFEPETVRARFVRLQIDSKTPVLFHLDEVEIYGTTNTEKNIALGKPADQSSVSSWSTRKTKVPISNHEKHFVYRTDEIIQRARLLAADLHASGVNVRSYEQELNEVEARLKELPQTAPLEVRRELYLQARWAARRLAFSNPLMGFDKLVVVKRFTQDTYPDVCLNHMPWVSKPGGDICVVTLAGSEAEPQARNVIDGRLGPGHVHGMDLWFDADRVVFGYAKSKTPAGPVDRSRVNNYNLRREEEPIHIFQIGIDGKNLRQLTDDPDWSDLDPTYLPSGEIAFVSERCGCSLQCNEWDKDETSCNIYVTKPDGSSIRRLSTTKDGDYLPHCLNDGTIGYTRWEYQERGWANVQSIWFVRPDGTGADALFKQHLNDPRALEDVRSIPGTSSNKLLCIATGHHTLAVGPVVIITPGDGMNTSRSIRIVTPGVKPPEGGMSGTAVKEGGVADNGGLYTTPWPLSEKYFLASYTYSNKQTDTTGYAVYLIDVFGTKELIYRDPNISCFIPIPLRPRPKPPVVPDLTDPTLDYAVCTLSNATYGCEGIERERAKYVRVAARLPWPYDNTHGGHRYTEKARPNNWTPVRILGDVPLESDGSAKFRVPVDTAVYFQLLDENHMELRRMRSFISFQPGETRGCVGCHETRENTPIDGQFPLAFLQESVDPTPPPWGTRPVSFLREIQPIFDRHCVSCHGGLKPAGGLDFSSGLTSGGQIAEHGFNRAFNTIIKNQLVAWSPVKGDAAITQPLAFGSHRSKLVEVLRNGACSQRAKLDKEEWYRLVAWIDANAPYHDRFANKRPQNPPYDLWGDPQLTESLTAVHARRCGSCHEVKDISSTEWIDVLRPERTLFLAAPLAKSAGGTQKCGTEIYESQNDPDYQAVRRLVETAVERAWKNPRRDLRALARESDRR